MLESCTPETLQRFEDADPVRSFFVSMTRSLSDDDVAALSTLPKILKVRVAMPPPFSCLFNPDILPRSSSADIWKKLFLKEFPREAYQYESNAMEEPDSWRDQLFVRSSSLDCSRYQ